MRHRGDLRRLTFWTRLTFLTKEDRRDRIVDFPRDTADRFPSNDAPYRADRTPQATDELARLAAEGRLKIRVEQTASASVALVEHDRNVRAALGGARGSSRVRLMWVATIALPLLGLALWALGSGARSELTLLAGAVTGFVAFFFTQFMAPVASAGQMRREARWLEALPFALDGYFAVLAAQPEASSALELVCEWQDAAPLDATMLRQVFGAHDAFAQVNVVSAKRAVIRSGVICYSTGISVGDVSVYRNVGVAVYLIELIDKVLLALHRASPLAHVTVRRVSSSG